LKAQPANLQVVLDHQFFAVYHSRVFLHAALFAQLPLHQELAMQRIAHLLLLV
jgi:hypothetical protein